MSAPVVVGVDVGSQGTCAQALEPDGTLVATTRWPHALSYPRAGWAEQACSEWSSALVRVLSEMRGLCAGREIVALSFGSQLDGLVACGADGEVARRLDVPRGTLLLTIDQVDRTSDGIPVLVSREHHVADAFDFTVLRRGPGEGGE